MNIIHLADLHFGTSKVNENSLNDLIAGFKRFFTSNSFSTPPIIIVSGDIIYAGSFDSYNRATSFFNFFYR